MTVTKPKSQTKKKKKNHRQQPHRVITIHNTSTENSNIKHHKSISPHNTSTVSTFYESQILRSQSHKHFIRFWNLKEKRKVNTYELWRLKQRSWVGQIEQPTAASGSRVAAWVSHSQVSPTVATVCHGLTAAARSRWESKLHGVGVGGGGGVVGVDECTEWVSLCLASLLSVSPLYSLLFFPFFTLVFLLSP